MSRQAAKIQVQPHGRALKQFPKLAFKRLRPKVLVGVELCQVGYNIFVRSRALKKILNLRQPGARAAMPLLRFKMNASTQTEIPGLVKVEYDIFAAVANEMHKPYITPIYYSSFHFTPLSQ